MIVACPAGVLPRFIEILPGQYFDAETGLHQNWWRDYDPSLGRYLQFDPIGLDGGINGYVYAMANPLRYIDPLGQEVRTCCGMTSAYPLPQVMTGLECMSKCLDTTIFMSSGWRTDVQNSAEPGSARKSQHLLGLAADVHVPPSKEKIRAAAAECGFFVLPKRYPNRVHIDLRDGRMPKSEPDSCKCEQIRKGP